MTPEQQRIAIAEACGWVYPGSTCLKSDAWDRWIPPVGAKSRKVPDFLNDLNAMHEAESMLTPVQEEEHGKIIQEVVGCHCVGVVPDHHRDLRSLSRIARATAVQRAEVFLRTIGKWKEEA